MSDKSASSNTHGQRIQAQKFDTPLPLNSQAEEPPQPEKSNQNAHWWHSQLNLLLCVFVLIAVAALLFAQLAPAPDAQLAEGPAPATGSAASSTNEIVAPWDESRRVQARTDSQEILSSLLTSKKSLEAKQVDGWAPLEFQQALSLARSGDDFYKLQEYQQAIDTYQAAADQLDALHREIPKLVESKVTEGLAAIDQGKSALAAQAFNQALVLDHDNIPALSGLQRAGNLDQVMSLIQTALAEEQLFLQDDQIEHLQRAQQQLEQVLVLDPAYGRAQITKQRIFTLGEDKRFRQSMSTGFSALFAGRYSSANSAFAKALQIRPDDAMAVNGYRQSLASNKSSSLQSLLNRAVEHESKEQWQSALSNYQEVLQRDPNLVAARLGEIRSRARAQLDSELRGVLADPLALSKGGQSAKAAKLLTDASGIGDKGPKLKQQIAALQQGVKATTTEIKVQFTSDELTKVSLRKAGAGKISLGRFAAKNLALTPGRYVLSGVRLGFRDVRMEIELYPQQRSMQSFSIRCDEPVGVKASRDNNDQA